MQQACSVPDALQGGRSRVEAKGYKMKLYLVGANTASSHIVPQTKLRFGETQLRCRC